jgi:hypothetical protein
MDKKHSYTVKTAFPSKLSFYTSAGTPIFYHGPEDSTPKEFLDKFPVGVSCHSVQSKDILNTLEKLLSPNFRADYSEERDIAIHKVFHPDRIVEKFNNTIKEIIK